MSSTDIRYEGGCYWPPDHRLKLPDPLPTIDIIIPALNEERSLPLVLADLPWSLVRRVVVADNGSSDRTAEVARAGGAEVIEAKQRGYGSACLAALEHLRLDPPQIVVFLDADYSDHAEELPRLLAPIFESGAEVVIGSRTIGQRQQGALLPQARFGNQLACTLIELLYGYRFTDLGPFRAIQWASFERLGMRDPNYGWTVELQLKAAHANMSAVEVPVSYRKRVGVSKISGTLEGTIKAGYKILYTIFAYYWEIHRR